MTRLDIERTELRAFTDGVRAEAARNLDLLRAIDTTLTWLDRLIGVLRADITFAEKINASLDTIHGVIDPDDTLHGLLEKAQSMVEQVYQELIAKRQSARDDLRLCEDDGIDASYTEAIAAAADLHNALNTLRWNIGEHDVDAEPQALSRAYGADEIGAMFDDMLSN